MKVYLIVLAAIWLVAPVAALLDVHIFGRTDLNDYLIVCLWEAAIFSAGLIMGRVSKFKEPPCPAKKKREVKKRK